jgi:hypothetical protein
MGHKKQLKLSLMICAWFVVEFVKAAMDEAMLRWASDGTGMCTRRHQCRFNSDDCNGYPRISRSSSPLSK